MSEPEERKKKWTSEWKGACKKIFFSWMEKRFGVTSADGRASALIMAGLAMYAPYVLLPMMGLWAFNNLAGILKFVSPFPDTLAAVSTEALPIQPPESRKSEDAEGCDFSVGKWQMWQGNVSTRPDDGSYASLPSKEKGVAFAYQGDIADIKLCEFSFVPRGEDAVNFVVSLDGVFQVVVGDNDLAAVSLRASEAVNASPSIPIREKRTEKERPRLLSSIKSGTEVKLRIHQHLLPETNEYEVRAEVVYIPVNNLRPVETSEEFVWVFTPSPTLQLRSPQISVGLIRGEDDTGEVAVNFLSPNPLNALLPSRNPDSK